MYPAGGGCDRPDGGARHHDRSPGVFVPRGGGGLPPVGAPAPGRLPRHGPGQDQAHRRHGGGPAPAHPAAGGAGRPRGGAGADGQL